MIAPEQEHIERKWSDLETRLRTFEVEFGMGSEEFYARYEAGELGDAAEFIEWASFYDMCIAVQQMRKKRLEGQ